ncbi:MAG: aminoacyl--tRNA ligase-related protein, partial [Pseudomonadota bacterium]
MFDLKAIRENPQRFDAAWARRGLDPQTPEILEKDVLIRKAKTMVQEAEAARNKASKQIGAAMGRGDKDEAGRLKTEVAGAKNVIAALGAQLESEQAALDALLAGLPNIPADDVPDGEGEEDNVEIAKWGEPRAFDFTPKAHDDLGEALGLMDFETAAKMSGSRFVILRGALSRLDRALAAMMLDMQTGEGFEETSPPLLVWPKALFGTGQLPKFAEDSYSTDEHFLIPTAEVSLTNTVRESILDEDVLPKRLTAHTPCFRSEAGSAGRDTKGMIR